MDLTNRTMQHVVGCILGALICGSVAAGTKTGDGIRGIVHINESFADIAAAHDPRTAPLLGLDFNFFQGANFAFGTVANEPSGSRVFLNAAGLGNGFGVDPDDYGLTAYKTSAKLARVNGGYDFTLKQMFVQQRAAGENPSLATGGGMLAQYALNDPTRDPSDTIDLQIKFQLSGLLRIAKSRSSDVFSLGLQYGASNADTGMTLTSQTGAFQGTAGGSRFTAGLFNPGLTHSTTDLGAELEIGYIGDLVVNFSVQNGTRFNTRLVSFLSTSGAPSGTGSFTFDSSDSFASHLAPAPGFESAQLTLVPEPASVALFVAGLVLVIGASRLRARQG